MARTGNQFAEITGNFANAKVYATWQLRSADTTTKIFNIRLREYLSISGSATYESSTSTFKLNGTTIKSGSYSYTKGDHLLGYKDIPVEALEDGSFPNTTISAYAKSFHFPATTETATLTSADIPRMELGSSITDITTTFEYPAVGMVEGILINAELLEEYTTKLKATLNGITYNLLDNVTTPSISIYFDEGTYNGNQEIDGDDSVLFPLNNLQIAQLIPNDRQINITFTLETYDADELKGTSSKNYTFQITNGSFQAQPTLDNDIETTTLTGDAKTFISNFSSIIVDSGILESNNGATIKEYIFVRTNEDSAAIVKSENSTHIFESPKLNDTFTVSVIDSRDFEVLLGTIRIDNENYFLLDYSLPQFTSLTIERPEQTAPYVGISLNGSFWNGNFGVRENTLTLEYRYKLSNQNDFNEWVSMQPTINENSFSYNGTIGNISANLSALFEIRATDTTTSQDLRTNISIPKGKSMFDWAEDYFSFNGELCINDDEVPCFQEDSVEDDGSRNVTLYDSQGNKLNVAPSVEGGSVKVILPTDLSNLSTSYNYFHPFAYSDNDVSTLGTKLTYGSMTTDYGDRTDATVYGVTVGSDVEQLKVTTNIRFLNNTNSQTALSTLVGVVRNGELTSYGGTSDSVPGSSRFTSSFTLTQIPVEEGDFVFVYGYKGVKTHDLDVISSNEMTNVTFEVSHINGVTVINNNGGGTGSGTTDYEELDNLPRINGVKVIGNKSLQEYGITIPTNVSSLNNDAGYLTSIPSEYVTETELNNKGYLTSFTETDPTVPSHVKNITSANITSWNNKSDFSGSYNDLTNKPELFSGNYNDLSNKPTIPDVSGFETKTDATAKLNEAKTYADTKVANLVGTAPATLDTLQEIAAAIEENEEVVDALNSAIGNKANSSDLSTVATSGSYNDLTDKPTIPTVPTNISAFTNDSGYITADDIPAGIEELTSPVRIWDLEEGTYQLPASCKIYYYGSSNTSDSFTVNSSSTLFVSKQSSYKYYFIVGGSSLVNYLYYGYSISSSGTNYSLKLNDIKIPTSTLAQYNLGYYATTSTITNLNSTSYVNPGIYGMNINAGTGIPTEITSGSQAILMVLVNKQAPSGVTYIRQDLYVPSKNKHWKRNVLFNGSSYTYPEWEEVVEDLSDYALKTEIPDISGKQDTLVSGTNIKTINGETILGSGDITIEGGSSIPELTENFNVWDLETGLYWIAPNVVMTNYLTFLNMMGYIFDLTEEQSVNNVTIQYTKAFLIVHNRHDSTGIVQFHLFMMGNAPTVLTGLTTYNSSTDANGIAISSSEFELFKKLQSYQEKLTSGYNIKTINGNSLLGSGDLTIEGGSSGGSGITELTSPVRIWDLEDGVYKLPASCTIYYYGATSTSNFTLNSSGFLFISAYSTNRKNFNILLGGTTSYSTIYMGYASSTSGTYTYKNLSYVREPVYPSANKYIGLYYTTSNIGNINVYDYLYPGEYTFGVTSTTTGVPSDITGNTRICIKTYSTNDINHATYSPYIRQDLYAPSLNKHWYRIVNYVSNSNITFGEWTEIIENAYNGGSGSGSTNVTPVTTISSASTHAEIPSAKAVYDLFNSIVNGDEVSY